MIKRGLMVKRKINVRNKSHRNRPLANAAPPLKTTDPQVLELWVLAGGRCEFHGCNEYLLQDKLTTIRAKLADIAHIVACRRRGARGNDPMPLAKRNDIENLFLACTKHHRMIDKKALVRKYPKELLIEYKYNHEERIRYITSLGDENETTVIRMIGNIRGNSVSISNEEIREAVLTSSGRYPRYLWSENHIEIDLTSVTDRNWAAYWRQGIQIINDIIDRRLTPAVEKKEVRHLSLFAFSRIPFLAYLGYKFGDKIPLDIYQKNHTGSEGWQWATGGKEEIFAFKEERRGRNQAAVAIVLSLSGHLSVGDLPSEISKNITTYSLFPSGSKPRRDLLASKYSLDQFRFTYASLLREIEGKHRLAKVIHVFPALPISASVIIGRELLRNVSPSLIVYDKSNQGFKEAIIIDSKEKG